LVRQLLEEDFSVALALSDKLCLTAGAGFRITIAFVSAVYSVAQLNCGYLNPAV